MYLENELFPGKNSDKSEKHVNHDSFFFISSSAIRFLRSSLNATLPSNTQPRRPGIHSPLSLLHLSLLIS